MKKNALLFMQVFKLFMLFVNFSAMFGFGFRFQDLSSNLFFLIFVSTPLTCYKATIWSNRGRKIMPLNV